MQPEDWKSSNEANKAYSSSESYSVNKPLKLYCDASANGLCACLVHLMSDKSERPVVYPSRTLTKSETNYAQIECEALAIVFAVPIFHQYLYED